MRAKGHVSPFSRGNLKNDRGMFISMTIKYMGIINKKLFVIEEIRVEAADGATRSRRTSIMSDSDGPDAIDGAFKRAMKKFAPGITPFEEEEEEQSQTSSFTGSQRSEVCIIPMYLTFVLFCYILTLYL